MNRANLTGFTEQFGELTTTSLVFHFQDAAGVRYDLSLGHVLLALKFAEEEGVITPYPDEWWAKVGRSDGCSFQDARRAKNDPQD